MNIVGENWLNRNVVTVCQQVGYLLAHQYTFLSELYDLWDDKTGSWYIALFFSLFTRIRRFLCNK